MPVAPHARSLPTRLAHPCHAACAGLLIAALIASSCTTTPSEPPDDAAASGSDVGQPGFGATDTGQPAPSDSTTPSGTQDVADGTVQPDPGPAPDTGGPVVDSDACADKPDGDWCWLGNLLTCGDGLTVTLTACPLGCLAPVGGLSHACAGAPCAGKADGEYCVSGELIECTAGKVTTTTPCPAGCVEGSSEGCLTGPSGDELCGTAPDGVGCQGLLLVTCAGGVSGVVVECEEGCVSSPPGLPDACAESPTKADFCTDTADGLHCQGSTLTSCVGGATVKTTACLDGCVSTGVGGVDHCLEPPPSGLCAGLSDGDWCAGDSVVSCVNEAVVSTIPCAVGCLSLPAGVPDTCADGGDAPFCTAVPSKASPSPPTTSCAYMDWERSPDGFYLVSQFGTTSDPTTLGNKTSCGYLQAQYDGAGCVYDQQTDACLPGASDIPWVYGHVDWDHQAVVNAVAAVGPGSDVPSPEYFYVAGAQRFGCGALLRVSHPDTGHCVVVYAEDGGPGATYEGAGFGGRRILDSSPAVIAALQVQSKGWLSSDLLYVEWGLPGDVPGQACSPCQSTAATNANTSGVTPWRLEHMVPACGAGDSGGSCPSGDGLYCGGSVGADSGTLYDCVGGDLGVVEVCATGCVTNPPGTPDGCAEAAGSCPSGDGAYCGAGVGGDPATLYQCAGGQLSVIEACTNGCLQMPPGTPDACADPGPATSCPSGNGAYCGGAVGADPDTLYQCTNGDLSVLEACTNGCLQMAAGTSDTCASPPSGGPCPSGDGAYCGGTLGLDSDTLYWCANGDASPLQTCDEGCMTNPPGTPDTCAGGGGAGGGDGALSMCNPFSPPAAITCGFGCYDGHYGSDYAIGNGTPVYSPIAGVVIDKVDTVPGQTCEPDFGNYVKIRQGDYDVFLAHMSSNILVNDDQVVSQGDPIGFVSNTGYTLTLIGGAWVCQQGGGYHLHLEVRKNGAAFNPVGSSDVSWEAGCSGGGVVDPPTGFCGDKINGLWCNGDTLVNCQGGSEASATPCPQGCQQMDLGTPDQCAEDTGGSCPSGNGAYCGSSVGLDANTLYSCVGGDYSVAQVCADGCAVAPPGSPDKCNDPPQGTCPSGNGLYCGSSVGLDGNTLYNCTNGNYSTAEVCSEGCEVMPAGSSDKCKDEEPQATCPNGNGKYCGGSVGLDSNTLYNCVGGNYSTDQVCSEGCEVMPAGTSDKCKDPPQATCPNGNGKYCGGSVGLDSNTLYNCVGGNYSTDQVCSEGCEVMPAGTSDKCKDPPASGCPSGNGLYCGGSVGLDGNTLYNCVGGNYSFSAWCGAGCNVAPPGQSDSCNGGSCPFGNGAYCGQSVGLDSNTLYNCSNGKYTVLQQCGTTCYVAPPGQPDVCP